MSEGELRGVKRAECCPHKPVRLRLGVPLRLQATMGMYSHKGQLSGEFTSCSASDSLPTMMRQMLTAWSHTIFLKAHANVYIYGVL